MPIDDHLRVPISINTQPKRYIALLKKVDSSTNDIKKTRIAIQRAGGSLLAASKIYKPGIRSEDFYYLVRIYGLSEFTKDTKATVKRLRACIRESGGNMKEGSKLYFNGVENNDRFVRLARKYGQLEYAFKTRQIAKRIRDAIRETGGHISNASIKVYSKSKPDEPLLWHTAEQYGQMEYIRSVTSKVKKLRAMIDHSGGNFAKVSDNKPHGKRRTAIFHNLAKYYGQLEYARKVRNIVSNMHSVIERAGADIEEAAMIYYGKTKYNQKMAVQLFTSLIKRYGQEEYLKKVKSRVTEIRSAIEKAGGSLNAAALIYYKISSRDQIDKDKIGSVKSAFFQLAKQYHQLKYAEDVKDIVKRIRAAIRRTNGNIGKAAKEYDPSLKKMEFYQLVQQYGQAKFREIVIKENIRAAIDMAGGNLTKASMIYYKSRVSKKAAFQALVKYHHLLTYAQTVRKKVRRIMAVIQKAKGNLRDAAEIYYRHENLSTDSKRSMFLDLVYRYGQSHFKGYVIRKNIRGAIDKAAGNILMASKIYYGKPNYENFYYLAKRHGQLKYARKVKDRAERIRRAIEKSKGNISLAAKIFGASSRDSFSKSLTRYGLSDYRKEIINQREQLIKRSVHNAVKQAEGKITEASKIYYNSRHYSSDESKYISFYRLLVRYGELGYARKLNERHKKHPTVLFHVIRTMPPKDIQTYI